MELERLKNYFTDSSVKKELTDEILELSKEVASLYVKENDVTIDELLDVSIVYLDFAVEKYLNKPQEYKFSTYYSWYIKTSIETYLGISKEPLDKIVVKNSPSV